MASTLPAGYNFTLSDNIANKSLDLTVGLANSETWSGASSNIWETGGNWSPSGIPAAGAVLTFGSSGSGSVVLATPRTAGNISFNNTVPTTISTSNNSTLTLGTGAGNELITSNGTQAINVPLALNSNVVAIVPLGSQLSIGGNVSNGTASNGITLNGNGTLVLGGNNTYSGTTSVPSGTLNVTGSMGSTPIFVSGGTLSLKSAGAVSQNTITVNSGGLSQTVAGAVGGTTSLALNGGVTTLSLSNNYSGPTTVGSGAVLLATNPTGSATGTSTVTVQSGGILGGSGSIGGTVSVQSGGILSPNGNTSSTATLNLAGSTTIASGIFSYNFLSGNVSDQVIANNLTLTGTETIQANFPNGLQSGIYKLLSATGTLNGTPSFNEVGAGVKYVLYTPAEGGNPEPGFYTLQTTVKNLTWTGSSSTSWDTSTANNWSGPVGTTYLDGGLAYFDDTAATTSVVVQASGVNPYSVTFNNNTKPYTLSNASGAAGIGGNGSVTLNGSAAVTFTSPNTYSGGTYLNAGSNLIVSNDNQLGTAPVGVPAANITFAGGTLSFAGSTTLNSLRTMVLNSGGGTLNIAAMGTTVAINNPITGTGALTVMGDGDLQYPQNGGTSTYSGGTVVTGGTIELAGTKQGISTTPQVNANGVLYQSYFGTGGVTLGTSSTSSTTLIDDYNDAGNLLNAFTFNGNITIVKPGIGANDNGHGIWISNSDALYGQTGGPQLATLTTITLASNTSINLVVSNTGTIGWNLTLAKQVVGPGSLTVAGGPDTQLYLAHIDNTYSGGTIVDGGATLTLGGTGSSYIPVADPTMADHYVATVGTNGVITQSTLGTGSLTLENGSSLSNRNQANNSNIITPTNLAGIAGLKANITLAAPVTLGSGTGIPVGLYNINVAASVTGVMSDAAGQHDTVVLASAANALTIAASNTYAGGTVVDVNGSPNSDAGNYAGVSVSSTASLGSGSLTILPGGKSAWPLPATLRPAPRSA